MIPPVSGNCLTRCEDRSQAGVVTCPERHKFLICVQLRLKYIFRAIKEGGTGSILEFTKTLHTDVIIIGAGPTGLSLACQLIRYLIDFVVVEKNATVTPFSKAIGVQARPKFHVLIFSNDDHAGVCSEFEREYGHLADCQVLPIDARVSELFDKEKKFCVFLRPDNHIAFISSEISPHNVAEYLRARHF